MVCGVYSNMLPWFKFNSSYTTNNWIRVRTSDMILVIVPITTQLFQNSPKTCINCKWCFDLFLDVLKLDNRIIWKFSSLSSKCKTAFLVCILFLFHIFIRPPMLSFLTSRCRMPRDAMQAETAEIRFIDMTRILRSHQLTKVLDETIVVCIIISN